MANTEYDKRLREFAKGIKFELPTDEEVEEILRIYERGARLTEDIRYYQGVSEEIAQKTALAVMDAEKEGRRIDITEPVIDYGLDGGYSRKKYRIISKLSEHLPESTILASAKAGILSLSSMELFSEHPLTFMQYSRINDLVRAAYYAYYKKTGHFKLDEDREKLIELYKSLLTKADELINTGPLDNHDIGECIEYFKNYNRYIRTGVIIERAEKGRKIYSPESYDNLYRSGVVTNESTVVNHNPEILLGEKALVSGAIDEVGLMTPEEYRYYKLGLMNLTKKEKQRYDVDIKRYQKSIK